MKSLALLKILLIFQLQNTFAQDGVLDPTLELYKANFPNDKKQIISLYKISINLFDSIGDNEKSKFLRTELEIRNKKLTHIHRIHQITLSSEIILFK